MKLAVFAVWIGVLVFGVPTAAASRHVVETVASGNIEADFSYDHSKYRFTHPHLTIKRGGAVLVDKDLKPLTSYGEVDPARYYNHQKSISILNLDTDPEPQIVLDLYWGGAHCCWYTEVYRYVSDANSYRLTTQLWGNVDYRPADLDRDGVQELISADNRFAYQFASFAGSGFPIRIWDYRGGRFEDVTRRFPSQIRRDARQQWRWAFRRQSRGENVGLLAAWAADECLLRHVAFAFRQLDVLRREHRLGLGQRGSAKAFLRHLRRFLRRTGYT
jgi:hypothetical protein